MIYFLLKGVLIGLAIAAPVGPIALLCIKRTLEKGKQSGFVSGLGAATADLTYGIIAAFGLSIVTTVLLNYKTVLQVTGGLFLLYLGLVTFFRPKIVIGQEAKPKLANDYLSTFGLTLTNPVTILSFMAIFAGVGFIGASNIFEKILLVLGVFLGSLIWWLFLSQLVGSIRHKIGQGVIAVLNKISGGIIIIFGILALLRVL